MIPLVRGGLSICVRRLICVSAAAAGTLKMVALWGTGGAGRDGDAAVTAGGWFGGEALLTVALTDLENTENTIQQWHR